MRPTILLAMALWLNFSCRTVPNDLSAAHSGITLGAVLQIEKGLFHKDLQPIGKPVITQELLLSIKERPVPSFPVKKTEKDSTAQKRVPMDTVPDLYRVEVSIADRIALRTLLNGEENAELRSYWVQNERIGLITALAFTVEAPERDKIRAAEALFLGQDPHGQLAIFLEQNGKKETLNIPLSVVLDFEMLSACWGKDRYGKLVLQMLLETGDSCPEGTGTQIDKIKTAPSYLKL